ncbi:MAG TPA: hypothetical protein VF796_10450, partial [Humisphaera sp.]
MPSEMESFCDACKRQGTVMPADYHAGVNWGAIPRPRPDAPRPALICSWYCPVCYLTVTLPRITTAKDRAKWRRIWGRHEQRIPFIAALMWVLDALPDGAEPPPVTSGHLACPKCVQPMERETDARNTYVCTACNARSVQLTRLISMCHVAD